MKICTVLQFYIMSLKGISPSFFSTIPKVASYIVIAGRFLLAKKNHFTQALQLLIKTTELVEGRIYFKGLAANILDVKYFLVLMLFDYFWLYSLVKILKNVCLIHGGGV